MTTPKNLGCGAFLLKNPRGPHHILALSLAVLSSRRRFGTTICKASKQAFYANVETLLVRLTEVFLKPHIQVAWLRILAPTINSAKEAFRIRIAD